MKMALARLRYFATDALDEWRHSPGVNLLATATLVAALFIGGLALLVLSNVDGYLDHARNELNIHVYLLPDPTSAELGRIEQRLSSLAEVSRIEYVDKEEALRRYREWYGGSLAALAGELEANPLPASFEVYLAPGSESGGAAAVVTQAVTGLDGVDEVWFDAEWLDRLDALLRLAKVGGGVLSMLVFAAVVLVMASVLRLAVYARRDEIEIMQLVGATPSFVRGPFIVAGLAQGLLASVAAVVLVEVARRGVFLYAGSNPLAVLGIVAGGPLSVSDSALIIVTGLVISLVGAWFAVRRTT